MKPSKELAKQITDELFTNGIGERAKRLVLELEDGKDGGGWCKEAVEDVIERILKENDAKTNR